MKFEVTIDNFNGPLDLMLYLIKDNKLDLFELNIDELADQYISFINQQESNKLEIASEYISELAGLIEYKSKKLLPRDKSELELEDLEQEEQDLVRRLIEYQRYKEVSVELADRFNERMHQFIKPVSLDLFKSLKKTVDDGVTYDQNPYDLMKAMSKVLERYRISNPHDVSFEKVELSVDDRMVTLRHEFIDEKVMTLDDLLMGSPSIHHLIVTFLAVLDMLRMGTLKINIQNETVYLKGAV